MQSRRAAALELDASRHERHPLHAADRLWVEKNCYVDVWIELLHALGLDPMAMLAFTVAVDFEGDQWTFFKPPHGDLRRLYGLDVQELYVWRPLLEHALDHLGAGRLISTEADAYWLPDTAGTDYRRQHTKTTIILGAIDADAGRLSYFHNAAYHTLEGEDFARTFRLDAPPDPTWMPLFAEVIRRDRLRRIPEPALRALSRASLLERIEWLPADNPIRRFERRFAADLPHIVREGLAVYHAWVFGTVRQLGAAAELAARYLDWLDPADGGLREGAAAFERISAVSKALILKIARTVNGGRTQDFRVNFDDLALAWDRASARLQSLR